MMIGIRLRGKQHRRWKGRGSSLNRLRNRCDIPVIFEPLESRLMLDASFELIRDINATGNPSSLPREFVTSGEISYFVADVPHFGRELWKTDGTIAGTTLVKDIRPGVLSSSSSNLVLIDETLYFVANDDQHGPELWKSDGTATGTSLVLDIHPGAASSLPKDLVAFDGRLIFVADAGGSEGNRLYLSDGTAEGTRPITNLASMPQHPADLVAAGDFVYFKAFSTDHGREIWRTDGTGAGTVRVSDVAPGPADAFSGVNSNDRAVIASGDAVYFAANDGDNGVELWTINPRIDGAVMLTDVHGAQGASDNAHPRGLSDADGIIYFSALDQSNDRELWRSDGTVAGTWRVVDINANGSSDPRFLQGIGQRVYFSASDDTHGREAWVSDGTEQGTFLLKDISPGVEGALPGLFTQHAGDVFFTAHDIANQREELWRTDGTQAGTSVVRQFVTGPNQGKRI